MDYLLLVISKDNSKSIEKMLAPFYKHLEVKPYVATTKAELTEQIKAEIKHLSTTGIYAEYLKVKAAYDEDPKANKKALKEFKNKETTKFITEMEDKLTWDDNRCLEEAIKTFHYPGEFNEKGEFISTHNPNSKWDYQRVGGMFDNVLPLKNGFKATIARMVEINFGPQTEQYMEACYEWENDKSLQTVSRESYATFNSSLIPFACLIEDEWLDRNDKDFFRRFNLLINDPKYFNYIVTAVECHI